MVFFALLIAVFVTNGIATKHEYRDWVIKQTADRVKSEVRGVIKYSTFQYSYVVGNYANSLAIKDALSKEHAEKIFLLVQPNFSRIDRKGADEVFLDFYDEAGRLLIGFNDSLETSIDQQIIQRFKDSLSLSNISGYEIGQQGLYYFLASPVINKNQIVGFVRLGLRDEGFVKQLTDSLNIKFGIVFPCRPNGSLFQPIAGGKDGYLKGYGNDSLFLTGFTNSGNKSVQSSLSWKDNNYHIFPFSVINSYNGKELCSTFLAINTSDIVKDYRSYLWRLLGFSSVFLVVLFFVLQLLFRLPLGVIQDLKNNVEREVTNRSKAIIDTNRELNQIFNSTANGLRIIDPNYDVIRVNDAYCKIFGIEKDEVEGKKCHETFPCNFCHTANCSMVKVMNGELIIEFDEVSYHKSGKRIRCIHTLVPFLGDNDEFLGVIEDIKDITERMNAEEILLKTERQHDAFLDNLTVGVFIKTADQKMVYQNQLMDNLFGELREGGCFIEFMPESVLSRWRKEDDVVIREGKVVVEEKLFDRFGNERSFHTQKFMFRGVDDSLRIGGISVDITSRVEAERMLRILSKAINASPISVVLADIKGIIEMVNPAFSGVFGFSEGESIGKSISTCVFPHHKELLLDTIYPSVLAGNTWQGELISHKEGGAEFWISANISPVKDRNEAIRHILIISEDVTFRKGYEKELRIAKERAEESDRLKMAFLANISHEIRTPLNAIVGFNSLLSDFDISAEDRERYLMVINQNSSHLLRTIENTIDLSKLETGQFKILNTPCRLNEVMQIVYDDFFEQGLVANSVKLSIKQELADSEMNILTDGYRLKQILENLISNALKYTTNGFVEFGYTLKDPDNLLFYVVDSGVGISKEKQLHLFQPFSPGASPTNETGGLGIGLPLCKQMIRQLNGEIWFQSSLGSGTSFYFTLPLVFVDPKFTNEKHGTLAGALEWSGKQILVVDDLEENFYLLRAAFKNSRAKVIWAKNGEEAINVFKKNPKIDVVLMDIRMPKMDGYQATREIKTMNNSVPVICQTAFADEEERAKITRFGFDGLFTKPIRLSHLVAELDTILRN
jgi:PAS domain S-box